MQHNHPRLFFPKLFAFLVMGFVVLFFAYQGSSWVNASFFSNVSFAGVATSTINGAMDKVLNLGLVGYWSMDGNDIDWRTQKITDRSSQYATGTITNIATTSRVVAGKHGQALDFNGTNSLITASSSATSNLAAMSVTAWIYPRSLGEGNLGRIVDKANATTPTNGWTFLVRSVSAVNQLGFFADYSGTDLSQETTANSIQLNQWQFVTLTWTGSPTSITGVAIYVNGSQKGGVAVTNGTGGRVDDATQDFKIGNDKSLARTFDGYIDDVRVYNRVLSQNEIDELYIAGDAIINREASNFKPVYVDTLNNFGAFSFAGRSMHWDTGLLEDNSYFFSGYVRNMATSTTPVVGKVGQSFYFDGGDDLVWVPGLCGGCFANELATRTIATWLNPTDAGGQNKGIIMDYSDNTSGWALTLCDDNINCDNAFRFTQSFSGATGTWQTATGSLVYGDWQYVAVTYDESLATNVPIFYINGVVSPTITVIPPLGVRTGDGTTQVLHIGNSSTTDQGFHGSLDELLMYHASIAPAAEILRYYNMTK